MSLIKDLLSHKEDTKLLKLLERNVRAMERIADSLEALLPSPLTSLMNRDLKPPVPEVKIYGEREAYREEQHNKMNKLKEELRDYVGK